MAERAALAGFAANFVRQIMIVAQLPAAVVQLVSLPAVLNRPRADKGDMQREGTQLEQRTLFAGFADDIGAHLVGAFGRDVATGGRRCQRRADDFQAVVELDEALVGIELQANRAAQVGDALVVSVVYLKAESAGIVLLYTVHRASAQRQAVAKDRRKAPIRQGQVAAVRRFNLAVLAHSRRWLRSRPLPGCFVSAAVDMRDS